METIRPYTIYNRAVRGATDAMINFSSSLSKFRKSKHNKARKLRFIARRKKNKK